MENLQNPTPPQEHWNDHDLQLAVPVLRPEGFAFPYKRPDMSEHRISMYDAELTGHFDEEWQDRQVLLELAVSKIEGKQPSVSAENLESLPKKVTESNYTLADELYRRMGPVNDMPRGDVLLISLAGLVIDEIAPNPNQTPVVVNGPEQGVKGLFLRTMSGIHEFTSALEADPKLAAGHTNSLLLAAELMSDALRVPESVRNTAVEHEGYSGNVDAELARGIVVICDALMPSYEAELAALDGKTSKKAVHEKSELLSDMSRTILTKYDLLFDQVGGEKATDQSRMLLGHMASDIQELMPRLGTGFLYETFVPLAFRFVALEEGFAADAKMWHATTRSDMPKGGVGARVGSRLVNSRLAALRDTKQSAQDTLLSQRIDEVTSGKIVERWQLKARSDAESFASEYDDKNVVIHSKDAEALFGIAATLSKKLNPRHQKLSDQERIQSYDATVGEMLRGLVREVGSRVVDGKSLGSQLITIEGIPESVALGSVFDQLVAPQYRKLFKGKGITPPVFTRTDKSNLVSA